MALRPRMTKIPAFDLANLLHELSNEYRIVHPCLAGPAAVAHAGVERHVVADGADVLERSGAVADQSRVLGREPIAAFQARS